MTIDRRQMLVSLAAGLAAGTVAPLRRDTLEAQQPKPRERPLRRPDGSVDWVAVRELFPLARDRVHLAAFLFVSHPRPVAEAIDRFRKKIDADPIWLEDAILTEAEGRPEDRKSTRLNSSHRT